MDRVNETESLILKCVENMLLMSAVENMTSGDILRAVSMIDASHPRPANGRVEGTAIWLTALCIRYARRVNTVPWVLTTQAMQKASRALRATREQVAKAAREMEESTTYETVVQLGASSLALAVEAASGHLVAFSDTDRETCATRA